MRKLLSILFVLLPAIANADFCNWGYSGRKTFRCNGEVYFHGSASCQSGFYSSLFCHERFGDDGRDCADDNSRSTMECYRRLNGTETSSPRTEGGYCNWGYAGRQYFRCNGETFVYGSAVCDSGFYSNVFCRSELSSNGKACANDNSSVTVSCYKQLMQPRSTSYYGSSRSGWPRGIQQ